MFRGAVVLALLLVAYVGATNVRQCSKNRPFPLSVAIEGCSNTPCDVIKGTTAVIQINFLGTRDNIQEILAEVRVTALGITVPYEPPKEIADVCSNLMYGASCPINKDENVFYKFKFPIEDYYPEMNAIVEISLVDQSTMESMACFLTDIKVKKGITGRRRSFE